MPSRRVAAVEVAGAADEFQIARRRSIHVVVSAGSVDHLGDGFADGGNEHVADARSRAARRGILAVEDAALGHMDLYRPHFAVAPRHVPEKRVGERQGDMRDGAGKSRVVIGVGLRARAGEVEIQCVAFLRHRAVKLLSHRFASFAVERRDVLARDPSSVGHGAQLSARLRLRIFDHFFARLLDELEAEFLHQAEIALGADVVAGDHRL